MVYVCEHCRFVFERTGEMSRCPDCGKEGVREASERERAGYLDGRAGISGEDRGTRKEKDGDVL